MKVLAVGDIHTKGWIIDKVESIAEDYDKVIFVGDYCDDWGKEPKETISTLKKLKLLQDSNPKKYVMIMGNHDFIYVNRTNTISGGYNIGTQLMIDEDKELKQWVANLPLFYNQDEVTYSHAGITDEWNIQSGYWNDTSPIWARPDYGLTYKSNQVFGHTPSKTCWQVAENVWCIDTFSTYPNGSKFGDETVLEITDGKEFKVKEL